MGIRSRATLLIMGLGLGLGMLALSPRATGQEDDIAVVVNSSNAVTNISLGDLRKMFLGTKRSWPSGPNIKLVTRGPGCVERVVLLRLLSMSESEYKQYWTAQVLRGVAESEPLTVPSVGMQKEALTVFPGALSLVSLRDLKPSMKVLKVDGLLPGTAGYPLR